MLDFVKNFDQKKIIQKGKPLGIAALCMAAVFIVGFGAGKLHSGVNQIAPAKRSLPNYNINNSPQETKPKAITNANAATANIAADCNIKGSKSKIYHMPGGSFYERTNADKCFATEAEAQAAGFTKSSR